VSVVKTAVEYGFLCRYALVQRAGTFFQEKNNVFNVYNQQISYLRSGTFLKCE